MSASTPFTNDDVEQILRVVDRLSDVEVRLEVGDLKLHVRKLSSATPAATESSAPRHLEEAAGARGGVPAPKPSAQQPSAPREVELGPGTIAIRAPMLGTFYRAPSPADPPFVEVGKRVRSEDPVCIIEVMKLFNTVLAGTDGTIVSIVAKNGEMVSEGDVLYVLKVD